MVANQTFDISDGWLLSTLIISGKKSTLKDIVLIGNAVNHAIFTLGKINDGLSRLESEGYIVFKNSVYLSDKAKTFDKKNKKRFEPVIDMQVRYSKILAGVPILNKVNYKQYFSDEEYRNIINRL